MAEFENAETLSGTVKTITYQNRQNGYTVLVLESSGESITVVGNMPFVNDGDKITCTGHKTVHKTYGEQFKADSVSVEPAESKAAVLKYLSSGVVKGVGPATATKIVEAFGENTLDVIENFPERLAKIRGISLEKAAAISEEFAKQFGLRDILILLAPFGVGTEQAVKIYKKFGNSAPDVIKRNPYALCTPGVDFPFEGCEQLADAFGADKDNPDRISAGINYVMHRNLLNGHTCLPADKLTEVSAQLLSCTLEQAQYGYCLLKDSFLILSAQIGGKEFAFLPEYYNSERYISAKIHTVQNAANKVFPVDDLEISRIENMLQITFCDLQKNALKGAVENGIFILTGGPGTGKTTTINGIINLFEHRNLSVLLAAPTGRAAKRISELTGHEAKTIHRMLEVEWDENDEHVFTKNERNPLDCDVLIIDEMSMVDTLLFEGVLRALHSTCRIIMVGDSDQLPSVGAGNILNDLLSSGIVPAVRLNTVFRQANQSEIITCAHDVIAGNPVKFKNLPNSDMFMLPTLTAQDCINTVVDLVSNRIPIKYGFNSITDIQVLCPSRKNNAGSYELNLLLQDVLNPKTSKHNEMYYKGGFFRVGDKVMQIKNNYDIVWERKGKEIGSGVYNGDIGTVVFADRRTNTLRVQFDDKIADYTGEEIGQLELAYAVTVHKSQGSEFECVILPLFDVPAPLRYRNLLYTAITRAKKLLIVVGSAEIFGQMVLNHKKTLRYTGLLHFLEEANK